MSDLFPRVWALKLEPGPKLTLLAIARFSILKGACWAKVPTIAEATGYGVRATRSHINALEKAGVIVRKTRRKPGGAQATNMIWLRLPDYNQPALEPPERPSEDRDVEMMEEAIADIEQVADFAAGPDDRLQNMPGQAAESAVCPPAESAAIRERLDSSGDSSEDSLSDSDESDSGGLFDDEEIPLVPASREELKRRAFDENVGKVATLIWDEASKAARGRSVRAEVRKAVAKALSEKTCTPDELIAAWRSYIGSKEGSKDNGEFQKGPCRWIRTGRYISWVEANREEARLADSAKPASTGQWDLGTNEEPTEVGMEIWMRSYMRDRMWPEKRGPEPGDKGCRVSPEIQRKHGVRPWEDKR